MGIHTDRMVPILDTMQKGRQKAGEDLKIACENAQNHAVPLHAAQYADFSDSIHTNQLVATARDLGDQLETATTRLSTQIEQFTKATEASGTEMNRWTFWMMVSSGVLAALTIVQVVIAVWSALHPDTP